MPNWCENRLIVSGEPPELKRFYDAAWITTKEGEVKLALCQAMVPCPKALEDLPSGSDEIGYEVKYTDDWQRMTAWPWVQQRLKDKGIPLTDRITQDQLFSILSPEQQANADRYKENKDLYGYHNWYEWCIANWGTKWGDCSTACEEDNPDAERLVFTFDSAWGPPVDAFDKIAGLFPELDFELRYEEEGMGIYGRSRWTAGVGKQATEDNLTDTRMRTPPKPGDLEWIASRRRISLTDGDFEEPKRRS